jgi:hypothetical protein
MNLTFYIIYTPDSFRLLKIAVKSLLKYTCYNYILVGNGLFDNESDEITKFVKFDNRLGYIDLPGSVVVPHGTALNHLFNISDSKYFCFMDSDVFAFRDFSRELESKVHKNDVVSSCKPIEWLHKKSAEGYRGHCTVAPSGKPVAVTYFSIYRRKKVERIINKYKISFERYMRRSQVPKKIQNLLTPEDQHTWKFNTVKLINILQAYNKQKFHYQEFDGLIHLGGVSRYSEHAINGTRSINGKNPIAIDRVATRKHFHDLLNRFLKSDYSIPELHLHDCQLQQNIYEVSLKLAELACSLCAEQ